MLFKKKKSNAKQEPSIEKLALIKTLIALFFVVVLFFGVRSCYRFMTGWDAKMHKNFKKLELGSLVPFVEETMGIPKRETEYELESFPVIDYAEIKDEAQRSGATLFYYYENGMRNLYILGFDSKNRMVFKRHVKT